MTFRLCYMVKVGGKSVIGNCNFEAIYLKSLCGRLILLVANTHKLSRMSSVSGRN